MKKYIIALIVILLVGGGIFASKHSSFDGEKGRGVIATSTNPVACTEEAKQCPDGSYVGRQGPKCEFAACPVLAVKKDCPKLAPVGPNFCKEGKIIGGQKDTNGCPMPPICEVAVDTTAKSAIIDASGLQIDEFLKKFSYLSADNLNFIKTIKEYDHKDAWGRSYSYVSFAQDGDLIYFVDEREIIQGSLRADVYSINTKTGERKLMFSAAPGEYYYNLIASQGRKLLFEKIHWMNSPGPCYSIWVGAKEYPDRYGVLSLDLENASAGFSRFTVPSEKYESAKAKEKICQNSL